MSDHFKGGGSLILRSAGFSIGFSTGLRRLSKNLIAIGPSLVAERRMSFSKNASGSLIACSSSSFESMSDATLTI